MNRTFTITLALAFSSSTACTQQVRRDCPEVNISVVMASLAISESSNKGCPVVVTGRFGMISPANVYSSGGIDFTILDSDKGTAFLGAGAPSSLAGVVTSVKTGDKVVVTGFLNRFQGAWNYIDVQTIQVQQ